MPKYRTRIPISSDGVKHAAGAEINPPAGSLASMLRLKQCEEVPAEPVPVLPVAEPVLDVAPDAAEIAVPKTSNRKQSKD